MKTCGTIILLVLCTIPAAWAGNLSDFIQMKAISAEWQSSRAAGKNSSGAAPLSNNSRIAYGEMASTNQFPFAALVYGNTFQCSGSLVSPRVVLTAAHCVYDSNGWREPASQIKVRIGKADFQEAPKCNVKVRKNSTKNSASINPLHLLFGISPFNFTIKYRVNYLFYRIWSFLIMTLIRISEI